MKENEKKWRPRGDYRARWDMPHAVDTDYNRDKVKESTKKRLREEEDDINWCPHCGDGSLIMNDQPCAKCEEKFHDDDRGWDENYPVVDDDEELQKLIEEYMGDDR